MEKTELKGRKRKRKHGTVPLDGAPLSTATDSAKNLQANGLSVKKAKKRKHTEDDDHTTNMLANSHGASKTLQTDTSKSPDLGSSSGEQDSEEHAPTPMTAEVEEEGVGTEDEEGGADHAQRVDQSIETDLPSTTPVSLPTKGPGSQAFKDLNLSSKTMQAIEGMGFENMTQIQQMGIPPLLAGRDVLGAAKTGSGKTLAFLIPAVEMLSALRFKPRNGNNLVFTCRVELRNRRYWSHRCVTYQRTCASDLWRRPRTHGTSLADLRHRHRGREPKSGGGKTHEGGQFGHCHTGKTVGSFTEHPWVCVQEHQGPSN